MDIEIGDLEKYTLDFKLEVVEYYLTTEITYSDLALQLSLTRKDGHLKWKLKKKVQRIVKKLKIQIKSFSRKSIKCSSYKGKVGEIAQNRIKRRFNTNIVHQKITTDTTEFKYYEKDNNGAIQIKKFYLDPFMDMYNMETCHV